MTFGRWRTQLSLQAALPLLATGRAAGGWRAGWVTTPSAFLAAFRRETGVTPSAYFGQLAVAASR